MILFLLFLGWRNKKRGVVKTFLYATFIGGVFEYLASFFLELFLGMKFWDYTGMFLSIGGRTTLPFMLVWGVMGTFVVKVVYPFLSKWIEKIPKTIGNILYYMLLLYEWFYEIEELPLGPLLENFMMYIIIMNICIISFLY